MPGGRGTSGARPRRCMPRSRRGLRRRLQPGDRLHPRLAPGRRPGGGGQGLRAAEFELGEAFQFDWSEEGLVVGGIYYRLQVSHMKLCASRAFWLVAYPSQGHEMLFDAHTRSFAALGGVPRRGIYDNMKTAVDKVKKGKGRIVNARFAAMCAHYLFDPTSATWPRAGRRASSRRTCRTAAGASGSRRPSVASAASPNSTPGWPSGAGRCGRRCATPSTSSSAWPRCWSTSART
jgi:hypothetical protein